MAGTRKHLLTDGEKIILDLRPHWLSLLAPAAWALLVVAAVISTFAFGASLPQPVLIGAVVAGLVAVAAIVGIPLLRWNTTEFILTSERVISREGIFAKKSQEIPLHRVNNVAFSQSIAERLLGSGNLTIESGGEHGMNRFVFIQHPEKVQNEIYKAMEAYEKTLRGNVAAPADDIPAQIEKLAALRDKGIVTSEEFEAKKKELLGRM